jgi:hypothetical protein
MRQRPLDSVAENKWAIESLGHVTIHRNGKVAIDMHLAAPYAAHLSQDGILTWKWTQTVFTREGKTQSTGQRPRKVSPRLWQDFASLANAKKSEEIRAFAERWGPLRHRNVTAESEELEQWRYFAKLASALLKGSVALGQAQPGANEDWKTICSWLNMRFNPDLSGPDRRPSIPYRCALLARALNRWYSLSLGNTLIGWQEDKLVIAPAATTLFGIIGLQLAYRITGATQMLVCHHCTRFFTPERKPSSGKRAFCPTCRRHAKPQLYAMRDYRIRSGPRST